MLNTILSSPDLFLLTSGVIIISIVYLLLILLPYVVPTSFYWFYTYPPYNFQKDYYQDAISCFPLTHIVFASKGIPHAADAIGRLPYPFSTTYPCASLLSHEHYVWHYPPLLLLIGLPLSIPLDLNLDSVKDHSSIYSSISLLEILVLLPCSRIPLFSLIVYPILNICCYSVASLSKYWVMQLLPYYMYIMHLSASLPFFRLSPKTYLFDHQSYISVLAIRLFIHHCADISYALFRFFKAYVLAIH